MLSEPLEKCWKLPADDKSFISLLDAKLARRNEKLCTKLIAWGVLLDVAGWCVALDLPGGRGIWLSERARKNYQGKREQFSLDDLLNVGAHQGIRNLAEGVWIWPDEKTSEGRITPRLALTKREAEVLTWMKEGKTSYEISIILGCAPRTLDKHISNMYRKLGVSGRTEAILASPSPTT